MIINLLKLYLLPRKHIMKLKINLMNYKVADGSENLIFELFAGRCRTGSVSIVPVVLCGHTNGLNMIPLHCIR